MQNRKAQVLILSLMIGLVVLILGLSLAPALQESISLARNASTDSSIGLDCDNESISTFQKAGCVASDLTLPYFIGFILFAAGAIILGRIAFQE